MKNTTDVLDLNTILLEVECLDLYKIQPLLQRCHTQDELDDVTDILMRRINLTVGIHTTRIRRQQQKSRPIVRGFRKSPIHDPI
jgi:hypothetical protein